MINKTSTSIASAMLVSMGIATSTGAEEVRIEFEATVVENQHLTGPYAGVALGETMTVTMNLIVPSWLDEVDPILGPEIVVSHYAISPFDFELNVGGVTSGMIPNADIQDRSLGFWNDWPVADGFQGGAGLDVAFGYSMSLIIHQNTGEMLETTDITQEAGERLFGWDEGQVPYDSGTFTVRSAAPEGWRLTGRWHRMVIHGICSADLDGNGAVGFSDLSTLLGQWGCFGCVDLDGDGFTGFGDLTFLLGAWGDCP